MTYCIWDELRSLGLEGCAHRLQTSLESAFPDEHGHFESWQRVIHKLPSLSHKSAALDADAVTFDGECSPQDRAQIHDTLKLFHPWRKGPFQICGMLVDAEWRSNLKWNRIAHRIDWNNQTVLDVGCGNGYYGYRMLGRGAKLVVGLEPYPLYNAQFAAVSTLAPELRNFVLPTNDSALAEPMNCFDIVVSMGVLYHCKDPIGHLAKLRHSLALGRTLILETLVVDGDVNTMLIPEQRYAKMRNVWFLPSTLMLERILTRVGFRNISLLDVSRTTTNEQRRTEFMTFESLADFLDPDNTTRTIEGLPAPQRAILMAHT